MIKRGAWSYRHLPQYILDRFLLPISLPNNNRAGLVLSGSGLVRAWE